MGSELFKKLWLLKQITYGYVRINVVLKLLHPKVCGPTLYNVTLSHMTLEQTHNSFSF